MRHGFVFIACCITVTFLNFDLFVKKHKKSMFTTNAELSRSPAKLSVARIAYMSAQRNSIDSPEASKYIAELLRAT